MYTSFQACDAYAYERLAAWVEEELGASGAAFSEAYRVTANGSAGSSRTCRPCTTACCLRRARSNAWG